MNIDLFEFIEKIFQGTVLFVFKYVATLGRCLVSPLKASLRTYDRFQSPDAKEVGPVSFAVIGVLIFWSVLTALLLASAGDIRTGSVASQLWAFDTSSLRVPLILVAVCTIATVVLLELLYRAGAIALNWVGAVPKTKQEQVFGQLRAVGFCSAGASAIIFPLCAAVVAAALTFAPNLLRGVKTDSIFFACAICIFLSPILSAAALAGFLRKPRRPLIGRLSAIPLSSFGAAYVGTLGALLAGAFLLIQLRQPLAYAGDVSIASLDCGMAQDKGQLIALMEIKNTSDRPQLVRSDQWMIRITEDGRDGGVFARSERTVLDDRPDPATLLLKPRSSVYGAIWFPAGNQRIPWGWMTCEVYTNFTPGLKFGKSDVMHRF
jgi:hypothetical protein